MTTKIPQRYENVDFSQLPEVIKEAYPILRSERKGLYIFGGVGTGKTHAAYGILKQWGEDLEKEQQVIDGIRAEFAPQSGTRTKESGGTYYFEDAEMVQKQNEELAKAPKVRPPARFENVPQMLYYVKRDFKDNSDYQDEILNTRKMFILDDIGVEKVSEFVEEFMYMLVNEQYEKVYPIVITSNLSLSELAEKLGDRVVSRIKEMCQIIKLDGEDKRLEK